MKYGKNALTLVEIMVSLIIVSFVFISAFEALSYVGIGKIRLIESSQIEKEAFFASERLIDLIKKGGTIDYEEYWNRFAIGNTSFENGHFATPSGFGNEGTMYYCLSGDGDQMPPSGCLTDYNRTLDDIIASGPGENYNQNYTGSHQRYGQYRLQYIDHNSDANDDFGDTNNDGNFIGDDDDLFLGRGPDVFTLGFDAGELYLKNTTGDERTFFRWHLELDDDAPDDALCPPLTGSKSLTGSGCLGTIQMLKLVGRDYGNNHDPTNPDADGSQGDGVIDTWIVHPDFVAGTSEVVIDSNNANDYWQNIFSNRIHVSKAEFFLYPNQDLDYAWADSRPDLQVSPYLQLRIRLEPSWRERRKIRGDIPVVDIATTVNLSGVDIF